MGKWLGQIGSWLASNLAFAGLQVYVWPSLSGLLAFGVGVWGQLPIGFLIPAVALTVAAVATAALRIDEIRERTGAAGKLVVSGIVVARAVSATNPNLVAYKLGITALNRASFPLEIHLDAMTTRISDRIQPEAFEARTVVTVGQTAAQFTNGAIDLTSVDRANQTLYGSIEASLRYGRPGRRSYPLPFSISLAIRFGPDGEAQFVETSTTSFKPAV